MRSSFAWTIGLALTVLIASSPSAEQIAPPGGLSEEQQINFWQERGRSLVERVRDASERLAAGKAQYSRFRHHRRIRSEDKAKVLMDIARAEADLSDAQTALERFPEDARRAGALPGWEREFEDAGSTDDFAVELAEEPSTPEAHLLLARSFRARASRYRSMAERHKEMGLAYEGERMRTAADQRKHCDRLAELETGVAEEYERLASGHEGQATP